MVNFTHTESKAEFKKVTPRPTIGAYIYFTMMDYSSEDYSHPNYIRMAVEIANEDGGIDDCAWCNSAGLTIEQEMHRYREGLKKAHRA